MIYLLKSAAYTNDGFAELIKIGFTDNWDRRYSSYILHNPTIKVLYKLEEGTQEDEYNLHHLFREFRYKEYGNEWFHYSKSIIEFFEAYGSGLSELRNHLPDFSDKIRDKSYNIRILASSIVKNLPKGLYKEKELINTLKEKKFMDLTSALLYVRSIYGDLTDQILNDYEEKISELDKNTEEIMEFQAKYYEMSTNEDKMRWICTAELSPAARNSVLDLIPEYFKRFYIVLGPERCKALGYNYSRMNKDCEIKAFDLTNISREIYSTFEVGEKRSVSEIKEILRSIYDSIGYKRSPKATDLSDWFEIKSCQIKNDLGQKTRAFELIKKLEQ